MQVTSTLMLSPVALVFRNREFQALKSSKHLILLNGLSVATQL